MGVRLASSGNNTIVATTPAGNTNTVISTTGIIGLVQDNAQVIIQWFFTIVLGAGLTSLTTKLVRGPLFSSTQVNQTVSQTITASTTAVVSGMYVDTPGVVGQVQYSIVVNPSGAAANSTIGDSAILAFIL